MTSRSFVWLSGGGGAWSLASNWTDVTDGTSPSLLAPGVLDSVTMVGLSGAQIRTITGGGAAAAAAFSANAMLSGAYGFGAFSLGAGGSGGLLQLGAGASLQAGSAAIGSGSMLVGPSARLTVGGNLSLGTAGVAGAALSATGGGAAAVLAMVMNNATSSIYVDANSIVEVGSAGSAAAGALTIDRGASIVGQGSADAYGSIVDNGTLEASGGTLAVGALSGTGSLVIDAGATLTLNGACGSGQSVSFAGALATLAINQEFYAPAGTITGFATGDAIDMRGSPISSASYTATGANAGVLTLYYGSGVADRLNLAGSYAGSVFLVAGDGAGGTLVTVADSGGGGGGGKASPGTTAPDQYVWTQAGSGAWNQAANWQDVTTGRSPAGIAPGNNNLVTISAGQTAFDVIAGPANAASLSLQGEVALSGLLNIGTLTVGAANGSNFTAGTLDLLAGTALIAGTASIADGAISVSGSAALLSVAGTLLLGGGPNGIGLPTAALSVNAGGSVQAAGLVMGGGSGASLVTDPAGTVEIGSASGAAAGAVTIDAGATLAGNGQVDPYGKCVDNGTILASGGTLTLGAVSGTGSLAVADGATLELVSAIATPIVLQGVAGGGPGGDGLGGIGAVVAFASERAIGSSTIAGWVAGDGVHVEGSQLTGVQYITGSNGGTLLLFYGSTVVGRLAIGNSIAGDHFVLTPDGVGGTFATLVTNAGSGGGGQQTGTDQLAWTNPVSGNWSRVAGWTDVTLGQAATLAPGGQTPVLLTGPGGASFQSIGGTGICASLAAIGNTVLTGSFTTGVVTVGRDGSQPGQGNLELGPATNFTATSALVEDGQLLCLGNGALLGIAGTVSIGMAGTSASPTSLAALGKGGMQIGMLALAGDAAVTVDATSWIEIGSQGGAAIGALTVDSGSQIIGCGGLDAAGTIIDNGSIASQGGTLLVGSTSGAGVLTIGTEATLALAGTDTCPIVFQGSGGGALLLGATAHLPTGIISGFAVGDSIIAGGPVDAVTYTPGAGGIGTLSLSVGGQASGQLTLAGDFAGSTFSVQPDGGGSATIILSSNVGNGPPAGTTTPDLYVWTGATGSSAWARPGNWIDQTVGNVSAAVAPGQNDLVTIAGGSFSALAIVGPANAASLSLTGTVSLAGTYAIGTLGVAGVLGLASGTTMFAASAAVAGGVALNGGTLVVAGMLSLGAGGALAATSGSIVGVGGLSLAGSALAVSGTASVEVGGSGNAAAGSITIDAGGLLQGSGSVVAVGTIVDHGTIEASGGTLVLGGVSGDGTLLVGPNADLVLQAGVDANLIADFAGAGTLTLAGDVGGAPAIADFGTGDSILLPFSLPLFGTTSASFVATGPGTGILTISAGDTILSRLTLLGSQAGRLFTVAPSAGGFTALTTIADPNSTQGNLTMTYPPLSTGQYTRGDLLTALAAGFPYVSPTDIGDVIGAQGIYVDYNTDGLAPAATVFGGGNEPPGVNVEVLAPLSSQTGTGGGPGIAIAMQPGYNAVFLEGNESIGLTDGGIGRALMVGNYGGGELAAIGHGDTLVGATGANTTFWAGLTAGSSGGYTSPIDVYVQGGGNDTIATTNDNAVITTSSGASTVFLGPSNNQVFSNGSDTIVCTGIGGSDTIRALAGAGHGGDVVFSSQESILNFIGGAAASTVVGAGAQIVMQGGSGGGSLLWAGSSNAEYFGGSGRAIIVGGSAETLVQGGSAPVTVFGGTGPGVFSGAAGSAFVVGLGASTVQAAGGDLVWLVGSAAVSVAGSDGANVYGGNSVGNNIYQAGAGGETLWGGAGSDNFLAGSGADLMISGGGRDTFSFTDGVSGAVKDAIYGFVPGQSTIALHGYGSSLPTMTTGFGDTFLHLSGGTTVIIADVTGLNAANFTFA